MIYRNKLKKALPSILTYLAIVVLLLLLVMRVQALFAQDTELTDLRYEVRTMKAKVDLIRANQESLHNNLDNYNKALNMLIPETEDFFTIVAALESISIQTGFRIVKYTVDIDSSSPSKISLTVQGDGNSESFMSFLRDYNFSGGRLITNEKMEFTPEGVGQIKLALNFYTGKGTTTLTPRGRVVSPKSVRITKEDVALMERILPKMEYVIQEQDKVSTASGEFIPKANPFN